jgi:hypothetical protein
MRESIANRVKGRFWGLLTLALASSVGPADVVAADGATTPPPEVHGVAETYAAPGVWLGWGVLHGGTEAATIVVVRIVTDPAVYPFVAVTGTNPFSQRRFPVLAATRVGTSVDVRVPRSNFADFPRTEFSFYGSSSAMQSGTSQLVVYYLGVPDTTPEFTSEAALDAYLADRLVRSRAVPGSKTP